MLRNTLYGHVKCEICGKSFERKHSRTRQIEEVHKNDWVMEMPVMEMLKCNYLCDTWQELMSEDKNRHYFLLQCRCQMNKCILPFRHVNWPNEQTVSAGGLSELKFLMWNEHRYLMENCFWHVSQTNAFLWLVAGSIFRSIWKKCWPEYNIQQ